MKISTTHAQDINHAITIQVHQLKMKKTNNTA